MKCTCALKKQDRNVQACHCQMQTSSLDFDPAAARSIKRAIKACNSLLVISGKLQKTIPKPALIFSDNFPGQGSWFARSGVKNLRRAGPWNARGCYGEATMAEPTCIPGHLSCKSLPITPQISHSDLTLSP